MDRPGPSASRVLAFLVLPAPPGPGHRFQARLADRLPAFLVDSKTLVPNPRQGILNSAQELTVCLMQAGLRGGIGFTGGHIDRVPAKLRCGGNRIGQTLARGKFLLL